MFAVLVTVACGGGNTPPQRRETAPGADRAAKTTALETGANLMQAKASVDHIAMYLNGFHVSKTTQDADGGPSLRMMGMEYIISEKLYNTLPADEKAYWQILSGQLRMPGLPDVAEKAALKGKMNSYGKTWHTWMTAIHGKEADPLPFGPPHLQ